MDLHLGKTKDTTGCPQKEEGSCNNKNDVGFNSMNLIDKTNI